MADSSGADTQREMLSLVTTRARPSELSTMDRDQLKDALAIGKRARALLRQRFRLDTL